jgi:peroxiredoxin
VTPSLLVLALATTLGAEPPPPVGKKVADFTLPEPATGKKWALADHARDSKATVIVFTSTACPVCNGYVPRLGELVKKHAADKVTWVGIASHPADDADTVAKYVRGAELPFPLLKDDGTTLADKLQIERVPTVLVLDAGRTVRYAGRIDDQLAPNAHKAKATTAELADALAAVLKGEDVKVPHTAAAGCKLSTKKEVVKADTPVTYHKHVAAILQNKCQDCHRPGEAGPFSLLTFQQAKDWSAMLREVVADDVMPPWHADAKPGHFKNDRRLSAADKKTLLAWVDQGCPEGDAKDAPPAKKFADGWRLGREPDEVLTMPKAFKVPASGSVPYEYVHVGKPFAEDKWVTAIEVRPEQRAVVHHIIAFMLPPGATMLDLMTPEFGSYMLGAYVPGDQPIVAGPKQARKIVKGTQILLEVHYTPNGKAVTDKSSIGLCYTKEPPETELYCASVMNGRFRIPPGAENHEVKSEQTFAKATTLLSVTPHMHVRGKAFKYEVVTKDGKRETILNVPKYDFNWQATYDFATPVQMPAGAKLECTAWYDNSSKNPFNPDPKKTVRWGDMTNDEMMIGFALYHDTKGK